MIRVEHLIKEYGTGELRQQVLKDLSFSIDSGEFVSVIGPSGAGKSTLLYQISLLDEPTSGNIYLDNRLTNNLNINQKTKLRLMELGYVFQDYALLPELTALENVALPLLMQGLSKKQAGHKPWRRWIESACTKNPVQSPASYPADNNNGFQLPEPSATTLKFYLPTNPRPTLTQKILT